MTNIIIAGGRNFKPEKKHREWITEYLCRNFDGSDITIISGCCSGADKFGEEIAEKDNLPIKRYPANWDKYGRAAGPIRNRQMAKIANICILFPGGIGTASMEKIAIEYGVKVIKYND